MAAPLQTNDLINLPQQGVSPPVIPGHEGDAAARGSAPAGDGRGVSSPLLRPANLHRAAISSLLVAADQGVPGDSRLTSPTVVQRHRAVLAVGPLTPILRVAPSPENRIPSPARGDYFFRQHQYAKPDIPAANSRKMCQARAHGRPLKHVDLIGRGPAPVH